MLKSKLLSLDYGLNDYYSKGSDSLFIVTKAKARFSFDDERVANYSSIAYLPRGLHCSINVTKPGFECFLVTGASSNKMPFVKLKGESIMHDYGNVTIFECGGSESLDVALAEITGEHPGRDSWAVNESCDMQYLVYSGKGELRFNNGFINELSRHSIVDIPRGTPYRVKVKRDKILKVFTPSAPSWNPEQHHILPKDL